MTRKQTDRQRVSRTDGPTDYPSLLANIKQRIRAAQVHAALSANAELIRLYWDIGRVIEAWQRQEGWGRAVIPRLACDLHNEMPEVKGFSERNIGRMIAFYREYPHGEPISPQAVAKVPSPLGAERACAAPGNRAISPILPQAVAKLPVDQWAAMVQPLVTQLPWGHNVLLMERVKDREHDEYHLPTAHDPALLWGCGGPVAARAATDERLR